MSQIWHEIIRRAICLKYLRVEKKGKSLYRYILIDGEKAHKTLIPCKDIYRIKNAHRRTYKEYMSDEDLLYYLRIYSNPYHIIISPCLDRLGYSAIIINFSGRLLLEDYIKQYDGLEDFKKDYAIS